MKSRAQQSRVDSEKRHDRRNKSKEPPKSNSLVIPESDPDPGPFQSQSRLPIPGSRVSSLELPKNKQSYLIDHKNLRSDIGTDADT
jgi:hypothetical protein